MRYKEYKKVDISWFDEVPSHWEIQRIASVFDIRKEKNDPIKTKEVLSLSAKYGVTPYSEKKEKGGNKPKSDLTKYNLCYQGDILVNCMNVVAGAVGISNYFGAVSPVYYPLVTNKYNNKYYMEYLFRNYDFQRGMVGLGKGIMMNESESGNLTTVRMRISWDTLKTLEVPIPPKDEQVQIARFLDWKINEIDRLIEIKKKKIITLDKFLNESIKKTLNNYNRKTTRLKNIAKSNLLSLNGNEEIDTINYLEISDVGTGFLRKSPENIIFRDAPSRARRIVNENNIIISTVRTYLKSIYKIKSREKDCIVSTGFSVLEIDPKHNIDYIYFVLLSEEFLDNVQRASYGVSYPAISDSQLMNLRLSIVEDRGKQDEIVGKLFKLQKTIDKNSKNIQSQINNLKQLKQSLISDVVTGKIDVRNVSIPEHDKVNNMEDDAILEENFNEEV